MDLHSGRHNDSVLFDWRLCHFVSTKIESKGSDSGAVEEVERRARRKSEERTNEKTKGGDGLETVIKT